MGRAQQGIEKETIFKITDAGPKLQNCDSAGIFFRDLDSHMPAIHGLSFLSLVRYLFEDAMALDHPMDHFEFPIAFFNQKEINKLRHSKNIYNIQDILLALV